MTCYISLNLFFRLYTIVNALRLNSVRLFCTINLMIFFWWKSSCSRVQVCRVEFNDLWWPKKKITSTLNIVCLQALLIGTCVLILHCRYIYKLYRYILVCTRSPVLLLFYCHFRFHWHLYIYSIHKSTYPLKQYVKTFYDYCYEEFNNSYYYTKK